MINPVHLMALGAALFCIGMLGFLIRRNLIVIFMSIELMLNAVNLNLVAFSNQFQSAHGQVFAVFVITVAAAEAATGLAILIALYRISRAVNADEARILKW
ncbi:MAG: NADH-quinone oxidoreductase subunit NuoK [Candidatus Abyssobacteria bacterium SURF_17]|jgi:NADH-quinone oxidoreductase subunit K|uniref:NADH-quinone oxidoreductase subunit K n=1 Tax=Candidatus Abyssobacteria bacterium SURF_17 TaxID=2093361 RepID=A0A419EPF1_9BACT|nr:MAG: NADH-quinone oxidoreductase subunit NuoK [Candidatus Abyssubacteria bacterium SURF_17]